MAGPTQAGYHAKTKSVKTIEANEAAALDGCVYGLANQQDSITNSGYIYLQLDTPAEKEIRVTDVIAKLQNGTTTTGKVIIYEAPTYTTGTTEVTPRNFNRKVGDSSAVTVYTDPSGISVGTGAVIFVDSIFGTRGAESITKFTATLKASTTYIASFQNVSGGDADMLFRIVFEEQA